MGISITEEVTPDERIFTARAVLQTSESRYVDGMDIIFTLEDGEFEMDPLFYENTPEYQGGEVDDALMWLEQNGEIVYK